MSGVGARTKGGGDESFIATSESCSPPKTDGGSELDILLISALSAAGNSVSLTTTEGEVRAGSGEAGEELC